MADTTAKKAPAKKTAKNTTKKAAVKTAEKPAKKTAKKSPASRSSSKRPTSKRASRSAPRAEAPARRSSGAQMAGAARDAVQGLTGKSPETVTALERSDDGWRVAVEVLELERIPSTTDVMATYEVNLDEEGELQGYRRVHRYLRGSPGDE
ncbi:MAG TPA: gas vesicle protein [Nocardioides sp.]|nr:gas vesicle protein [Nocardioides sp.]